MELVLKNRNTSVWTTSTIRAIRYKKLQNEQGKGTKQHEQCCNVNVKPTSITKCKKVQEIDSSEYLQ